MTFSRQSICPRREQRQDQFVGWRHRSVSILGSVLDNHRLDPEAIFELGEQEVARILDEMTKVQAQMGVKGTRSEFFQHLRSHPDLMPYRDAKEVIADSSPSRQRSNHSWIVTFPNVRRLRLKFVAPNRFAKTRRALNICRHSRRKTSRYLLCSYPRCKEF